MNVFEGMRRSSTSGIDTIKLDDRQTVGDLELILEVNAGNEANLTISRNEWQEEYEHEREYEYV